MAVLIIVVFLLISLKTASLQTICSENCLTCLPNTSNCSECLPNYLLINSQCILQSSVCQDGFFYDTTVMNCVAICNSNQLGHFESRTCIQVPTCSATFEVGNNIPSELTSIVYLIDWNYIIGISANSNQLKVFSTESGSIIYTQDIFTGLGIAKPQIIAISTFESNQSTTLNSISATNQESFIILLSNTNIFTIFQIHMFAEIYTISIEQKWLINSNNNNHQTQLIDYINLMTFSLYIAATNKLNNLISILAINPESTVECSIEGSFDHLRYDFHLLSGDLIVFKSFSISLYHLDKTTNTISEQKQINLNNPLLSIEAVWSPRTQNKLLSNNDAFVFAQNSIKDAVTFISVQFGCQIPMQFDSAYNSVHITSDQSNEQVVIIVVSTRSVTLFSVSLDKCSTSTQVLTQMPNQIQIKSSDISSIQNEVVISIFQDNQVIRVYQIKLNDSNNEVIELNSIKTTNPLSSKVTHFSKQSADSDTQSEMILVLNSEIVSIFSLALPFIGPVVLPIKLISNVQNYSQNSLKNQINDQSVQLSLHSTDSASDSLILGLIYSSGTLIKWDLLQKQTTLSQPKLFGNDVLGSSLFGLDFLILVESSAIHLIDSQALTTISSLQLDVNLQLSQVNFSPSLRLAIALSPQSTLVIIQVVGDNNQITINTYDTKQSVHFISDITNSTFFTCSESTLRKYNIQSNAQLQLVDELTVDNQSITKCYFDSDYQILLVKQISSFSTVLNDSPTSNISINQTIPNLNSTLQCNLDVYIISPTAFLCLDSPESLTQQGDYVYLIEFYKQLQVKLLLLPVNTLHKVVSVQLNEFVGYSNYISVYLSTKTTTTTKGVACDIKKYVIDISCTNQSNCFSIQARVYATAVSNNNCNNILFSPTLHAFYTYDETTGRLLESSKISSHQKPLNISNNNITKYFLIPKSQIFVFSTPEYLICYSSLTNKYFCEIKLRTGEKQVNSFDVEAKFTLMILSNQRIFRINKKYGSCEVDITDIKELLIFPDHPEFVIGYGRDQLVKVYLDEFPMSAYITKEVYLDGSSISNLMCIAVATSDYQSVICAGTIGQFVSMFSRNAVTLEETMRVDHIDFTKFSNLIYDEEMDYVYLVSGPIINAYQSSSGILMFSVNLNRKIITAYLAVNNLFVITDVSTCVVRRTTKIIDAPVCNGYPGTYIGSTLFANTNYVSIYTNNIQNGSYVILNIVTGNRVLFQLNDSVQQVQSMKQDVLTSRVFIAYQNGFIKSTTISNVVENEQLFFHPALVGNQNPIQMHFDNQYNRIFCLVGSQILYFQVEEEIPVFMPFEQISPMLACDHTINNLPQHFIIDSTNKIFSLSLEGNLRIVTQSPSRIHHIFAIESNRFIALTANQALVYGFGAVTTIIKAVNVKQQFATLFADQSTLVIISNTLEMIKLSTLTYEYTTQRLPAIIPSISLKRIQSVISTTDSLILFVTNETAQHYIVKITIFPTCCQQVFTQLLTTHSSLASFKQTMTLKVLNFVFFDGTLLRLSNDNLQPVGSQINVLTIVNYDGTHSIDSAVFSSESKLFFSIVASRKVFLLDIISGKITTVLSSSTDSKKLTIDDTYLMISTKFTLQFKITSPFVDPFYYISQPNSIPLTLPNEAQTFTIDTHLFLRISIDSICLLQSLNLTGAGSYIQKVICFSPPNAGSTSTTLNQPNSPLRYLNRIFYIEQSIFLKIALIFDQSGSVFVKQIFLTSLSTPFAQSTTPSAFESFGYLDFSVTSGEQQQKCLYNLSNGNVYEYLRMTEFLQSEEEFPELVIFANKEVPFHNKLLKINSNTLTIKGDGVSYITANPSIAYLSTLTLKLDNFLYNIVSNIGNLRNSFHWQNLIFQRNTIISTDKVPARSLLIIPAQYSINITSNTGYSKNTTMSYRNLQSLTLTSYHIKSIFFESVQNLFTISNVTSVIITNLEIDSCYFSSVSAVYFFESIRSLKINTLTITNNIIFGAPGTDFSFLHFQSIQSMEVANIIASNNKFVYQKPRFKMMILHQMTVANLNLLNLATSLFTLVGIDSVHLTNGTISSNSGLSLISSTKKLVLIDESIVSKSDCVQLDTFVIENNSNMLKTPTELLDFYPSLIQFQNVFIELIGVTYANNYCYFCQGSIQLVQASAVYITSSVFKNNLAYSGGAIYAIQIGDLVYFNNSSFVNNTAHFSGGGLFLADTSVNITSTCAFSENRALIGGAVRQIGVFRVQDDPKQQLRQVFSKNKGYIYGDILGFLPVSMTLSINDWQTGQQINASELDSLRSGQIVNIFVTIFDIFNQPVRIISNPEFDLLNPYQNAIIQREFQLHQIEITFENPKQRCRPDDKRVIPTNLSILGSKIVDAFNSYNSELNAYVFQRVQLAGAFNEQGVLRIDTTLVDKQFQRSVRFPSALSSLKPQQLSAEINVQFRECLRGEIVFPLISNIDLCQPCQEGSYSLGRTQIDSEKCLICPEGAAECRADIILMKDGYWRNDSNTDEMIECEKNAEQCKGDANNDQIGYCLEGYTGPLCESCDTSGEIWGERYSQKMDKRCAKCANPFVVVTISIVFALAFTAYIFLNTSLFLRNFQKNSTCYYLRLMRMLPLSASQYRDLNASLTKQLLNYIQLSVIFTFQNIGLPDINNLLNQSIGNPTVLVSYSIDCLLNGKYIQNIMLIRAQSMIATPMFLIGMQWMVLATLVLFKVIHRKTATYLFYTVTSFIPAFYLSGATSSLAEMLGCRQIGSQQYSLYDPKLRCDDNQSNWKVVAWVILIFWFCFPVFVALKLSRIREQLHATICKYKYGYFYLEYNSRFYYWEAIRYLFKIAIVVIFKMLQTKDEQRRIVNIILIMMYMFLIRKYPVFRSQLVQKNEIRQFEILLAITCCEYMTANSIQGGPVVIAVSLITQLVHFGFIGMSVWNIIRRFLMAIDIKQYPRINNILKSVLSTNQYDYFLAQIFVKSNFTALNRWKKLHRQQKTILSINADEIIKSNYMQKLISLSNSDQIDSIYSSKLLHVQRLNNNKLTEEKKTNHQNNDLLTSSCNIQHDKINTQSSLKIPFKKPVLLSSLSLEGSLNFVKKQESILDFSKSEQSQQSFNPLLVNSLRSRRNSREVSSDGNSVQRMLNNHFSSFKKGIIRKQNSEDFDEFIAEKNDFSSIKMSMEDHFVTKPLVTPKQDMLLSNRGSLSIPCISPTRLLEDPFDLETNTPQRTPSPSQHQFNSTNTDENPKLSFVSSEKHNNTSTDSSDLHTALKVLPTLPLKSSFNPKK